MVWFSNRRKGFRNGSKSGMPAFCCEVGRAFNFFSKNQENIPRAVARFENSTGNKTTVSKVVHAAKGAFSLLSQEQRLDQVLLVAQAFPVDPRLCWVTQINVYLFSCVSRLPKGRHIGYRLFTSRFATWIFFLFCFVFFDPRVELRALRKLGKCSYAPGPLFGFDTRPCYIVQVALNF